jgi:hypothetical protein
MEAQGLLLKKFLELNDYLRFTIIDEDLVNSICYLDCSNFYIGL